MKKNLFSRLLCGLLCIGLTGCGNLPTPSPKPEEETEEQKETEFRKFYSIEVQTLNYLTTNSYNETEISANIIDCLIDYDNYGNILPALAESWEHNDNMTEWTFHIRPDVHWVDYQGNIYADVKADDWVACAEYVNNASHESTCQYMYSSGSVVHGAQEYYDYTEYLMESANGTRTVNDDGEPIEPVPEARAEDIGVKALDDYTLVYTLDQPCPFFLTVLSYPSYMPVNRQYLEEAGDMFGRDNQNVLYNGAYILSYFQPQEKRILTKNLDYWDIENVHIDKISEEYNLDAYMVQTSMFLNGEIDHAQISTEMLDTWMSDDKTKDLVHPTRPEVSYSYFYCFNFNPQFPEAYEPDNWRIAVKNENFRQAIMASINRQELLGIYEPYHPENLISNTITPKTFAVTGGKDYTEFDALKEITHRDSFSIEKAQEYRDIARPELEEAGVTFPIKILLPYNPASMNWDYECALTEAQIEEALGTDFVDVIVEAGPETGFLSAVRRNGNYALLKCNWGADYADPETWADPFAEGSSYMFWDKCDDPKIQALFAEWSEKVSQASNTFDNDSERYRLFSEAERILVEHAIVAPFSIALSEGYIVSKLNQFEGEFAPVGIVLQRYKRHHLYEVSMSMDEYEKCYQEWLENRVSSSAQ